MSNQGFGSVMPPPELPIDQDLARRLLADQHPDLADLPLRELSRGWDNTMFRLGPDLTLRLPHREMAGRLILAEQRWLGQLAATLPLPIPAPVRTGDPTDYYPWAWSVVPWFEGAPIGVTPNLRQSEAAGQLGRFLAALHRPAPDDAPFSDGRGVPLADRHDVTVARIEAVDGRLDGDALLGRWHRYLALPVWDGPPLWVHGDLHPLNLLQHDGAISAVIDFGDLTSGDPATDLAIGFSIFDDAGRDAFRRAADSAVRPIDDAMWKRAEGWAMSVGLAVVTSSADSPLMYQVGLRMIG